jgi:O-antigen biosynthesis protein
MAKRRHQTSLASPKAQFPSLGVNIVIPFYGAIDWMRKCLASIPEAARDTPFNVIVVDDCYQDGLEIRKLVAETPYHITLLRNKENIGFGNSCNRGAQAGGSRLIYFLNTDTESRPESISCLAKAIMADPSIAIAGPRLLFPIDSSDPGRPAGKIQHAGIEINIRGEPFHIFLGWSRNHPKVVVPRFVIAVTGAALMIKREDFNAVGGFDPLWGRGCFEDIDICLKVQTQGKKVLYFPQAEAFHEAGGSKSPFPLQQNLMIFKARWGGMLRWSEWELW